MAKLIILETTTARKIKYAMWANVPAARQVFYANATFASAFVGIQAGDLASLRSGALVERVVEEFIDGNNAAIRTVLEGRLSVYQTEISDLNNWIKYGSTFDGTTWTAAGAT